MESGGVDVHNRDASTTSHASGGGESFNNGKQQEYSLYPEKNYQQGGRSKKENKPLNTSLVPMGLGVQGAGNLFTPLSPNNPEYYYFPTLSPRQQHFEQPQQQQQQQQHQQQERYPGLNQEQRRALPPLSTRVSGQISFPYTPNLDSGFASSTSTPNPQFSFNTSSPMAPPVSTPQSSRSANPSLRDRLGKALAARKKTNNQSEETELRPDSHGRDSIALTHTTTHSRSQSGVSTPPTGYSDPSPIFSGQMKTKVSEIDEEGEFDSEPWSHDDPRYHGPDGFNGEYLVRSNYLPNTPLDTITEEEARLVAHRSAMNALNSSSPAPARHPVHSSSFEVTVSTEKSHGDESYCTNHEDSAISSLRFGSSHVLPTQSNAAAGADDSFGTNYYSSDESFYEEDHGEARPVVSNPHMFQSSIASRSLTQYPASEYADLTGPSFGSDGHHFVVGSQEFQSDFASQDFTERSILPSQKTASWKSMAQATNGQLSSSQAFPQDQSNRNDAGRELSVSEMLSVIPESSHKSSSSRPGLNTTGLSFAGIESGPNVVVSGTLEAAKASSSILGPGSIRSTSDNSSAPSRMNSSSRSVNASVNNSAVRLNMGPRSLSTSSRGPSVSPFSFGTRPSLSRNASDRSPASPGAEDYFRRDLENQLKRLSKISASSEVDGMSSSGIAVVVNVGENKIRTSSWRGSIEMLTGFDGNNKHASMHSRHSGESQDGLLSGQPSPAIIEEDETKADSRLSPDGEGSGSSQDSQDRLNKPDGKLLKSQKLPDNVLLHPADPRYEHIYRMREITPTEERIMVPVYQFPTPGSFPNRNALTRPITRKVSQRVESGSIASLHSARAKTPEVRHGEFEDIPLVPIRPGSKVGSEGSNVRQQLKHQPLGASKSSLLLPSAARSKSPSFHIDLQAPAPVADIHPALRPPRHIRPASPHLVPNSSIYYMRDLEASRMTSGPELMEKAVRISRFIFLCCFLFPPCLLIFAYGGFDGLVAECSKGKVAGVTDHYKMLAKWIGWGLAVTIVAGVSGAIIGAILVSSTSIGA